MRPVGLKLAKLRLVFTRIDIVTNTTFFVERNDKIFYVPLKPPAVAITYSRKLGRLCPSLILGQAQVWGLFLGLSIICPTSLGRSVAIPMESKSSPCRTLTGMTFFERSKSENFKIATTKSRGTTWKVTSLTFKMTNLAYFLIYWVKVCTYIHCQVLEYALTRIRVFGKIKIWSFFWKSEVVFTYFQNFHKMQDSR